MTRVFSDGTCQSQNRILLDFETAEDSDRLDTRVPLVQGFSWRSVIVANYESAFVLLRLRFFFFKECLSIIA